MVAELLVDVKQAIAVFAPFSAVPIVILLNHRLADVETELKRQVQWAMREVGQVKNLIFIKKNNFFINFLFASW